MQPSKLDLLPEITQKTIITEQDVPSEPKMSACNQPQNVKSFHIQTVPPHHIKELPMMYLCFFATF